jgi:predicted small lipoprotein YifL
MPTLPAMPLHLITRRRLLTLGAALPAWSLAGCGTPLPLNLPEAPASDPAAERLMRESAETHGLAAYRELKDINVRYDGSWRPTIDRIQPVVVDKGFRGWSEERLLPQAGVVAQAYTGPAGRKQVWWQRGQASAAHMGEVAVWLNGQASASSEVQAASALVAEAYGLFLLGPLWLVDQGHVVQMGGSERVDGRPCRIVQVWKRPGLGRVALDRVAVCIDAESGITRRVRFTLEGFANTRGAVAEVDTFEHTKRFGVLWPMRSYEEVVHPLRLPAHDWHITGLDVNRGYDAAALRGPQFTGAAAASAAALA